jgi:hypothetical protein
MGKVVSDLKDGPNFWLNCWTRAKKISVEEWITCYESSFKK